MKKYFWFNLVCIAVSGVFLAGISFVWFKIFTENTSEILVLSKVENKQQVANNNTKEIKKLDEVVDRHLERSGAESKDLVVQRDSSTSTSAGSVSAQNDGVSLPKEFNLTVPFTSQAPEKDWKEPWQDACEEAALLMLDAYYKHYGLSVIMARDEILKMVAWEEKLLARQASPGEAGGGWGASISIENIKIMASDYFHLDKLQKQIKIIESPSIEQIKKSIVAGNPVLAVADGKILPNPHFRNGGPIYHALVIKGYDEENFITNDPGTQFGESFKYKYNDLLNAIHDWDEGAVKSGKKVVLVLE